MEPAISKLMKEARTKMSHPELIRLYSMRTDPNIEKSDREISEELATVKIVASEAEVKSARAILRQELAQETEDAA